MTYAVPGQLTRLWVWVVFLACVCVSNLPALPADESISDQLAIAKNWTNYSGLTAVSWGSNRVDVFAVGLDKTLQHKFYDGVWHDWTSLGGTLTSEPSVVSLYPGHLLVFVKGKDNAIWHKFYLKDRWSDWLSLGGKFASGPRARTEGTHLVEVIAEGMDTVLRRIRWSGAWQNWETIKTLPEKSRYASRQWQAKDGLPHNFVYSVCQTQDGYLWVGTQGGLARFDGIHFTSLDFRDAPALQGQAIRFIHQVRDGTVWIGGSQSLACWKDGHFSPSPIDVRSQIKALLEAHDGSLWIGTLDGLLQYKDGKTISYSETDGLVNKSVLSLCESRDGTIWIGTNLGLSSYEEGKFVSRRNSGLAEATVLALFCDRANNLWVGLRGGGIFKSEQGGLRTFRKQEGVPDGFINSIFEDSRDVLWVGTMGGLGRKLDGRFVTEFNTEGASYETVFCAAEDREGNLWLGTKEGLTQLQLKPFESKTKLDGLSHNNVTSVREDQQGNIWLTTWGGGANKIGQDQIISYNRANSPFYDLLLSSEESRDGSLWFGADHDGGLFQYKDGVLTRFGREQGIIDPAIRAIHEDRQTNLWIGTSGALYRMREKQFQRFTRTNGLSGDIVRTIHEDYGGNIWIGTESGLSVIASNELTMANVGSPNLKTISTLPEAVSQKPVVSIHEDKQRTLWIGTDGGGLVRMKNEKPELLPNPGNFTYYTSKQGLFSDTIFEILEDDRENLWMSSLAGVFRVRKSNLDEVDNGKASSISCYAYGKEEGMSSVLCNGVSKPAGWKSRDGRLWFPTTRGVVMVDPKSIKESNSRPPVLIEKVLADRRELDVSRLKSDDQKAIGSATENPRLQTFLPPGKGELEFHYTALSLRNPEKNRFKYKLEGIDSDWINAETRRLAHYTHVPPGEYQFRVMGCNSDGLWNETGDVLAFVLTPHFWQTRWFTALVILGAAGLVAGSVRYVIWRRVKIKLLALEQQHAIEKERIRIAQDMHDELGSRLTEIQMLSDRGQEASQAQKLFVAISRAARETTRSLDAIVWAVNPRNDSLARMIAYISNYVVKFLSQSSISCRLEIPNHWPEHVISSEMRHNIFLAVKEAVNNIAKHSEASQVTFQTSLENNTLMIVIQDDGKGFSTHAVSEFGNGLQNIQKRMLSLKGEFDLWSEPGKGTKVSLKIPLRTALLA